MEKVTPKTVEEYIALFSEEEQKNLKKIRQTIKKAVPKAEERISYQMPAYKYYGYLVYFAVFRDHYSLFIPPIGIYQEFKEELAGYKISKATLQFPKSKPIPFDLVAKLVKRAAEINKDNEATKSGY